LPTLRIVTINLLNGPFGAPRWEERRVLLAQELDDLRPDVVALQEVSLREGNAAWLADRLGGYNVSMCPRTGPRAIQEAIAVLSRVPVARHVTLDLEGQFRVAQAVELVVEGKMLVVANGHFYWWPGESPERERQVRMFLDWLGARWPGEAIVACGDFNGTPKSRAIRLMLEHFTSAHAARHGGEPEYTCPTPLVLPASPLRALAQRALDWIRGRRPWRGTLDYIFVNDRLRVLDCDPVLNQPSPHDPTLYPSDHFGLAASLQWD
jgi:endonuclease/exonuclease/phosphatase family metal-dependent hydrolase